MDVRDSPWRPPREREEGGGKSSAENRREAGPGNLPPRTSAPAGPFAEQRRPNPAEIAPLIPHPPPQAPRDLFLCPPRPHFNVSHLSALCVNTEAPCTQPPQELVGAHAHRPVAHNIAHLLLARTPAGALNQTFRSRLLSAILPPHPLSTRFASWVSPTPTTVARGPLLAFALRPPAGERGAPGQCFPARVL